MRITIDAERCTGHGRCYAVAPDLVAPDDDGRGMVVDEEVAPGLEAQARAAEANCPERAVCVSP